VPQSRPTLGAHIRTTVSDHQRKINHQFHRRSVRISAACAAVALVGGAGGVVAAGPGSPGPAADRAAVAQADLLAARDQQARASRDRERAALSRQRLAAQARRAAARRAAVAEANRAARQRTLLEARRKARIAAKARATARAKSVRAAAGPRFVLPLTGYRLSAGFGQSGSLWSRDHTGQDFAAPSGTPVRAVAAGTVVSAGWDGAYGRKIEIRHAGGTTTWYCHLSAFAVEGGKVRAGQTIGRVGSTGNTTGPHLHLEVRVGDQPVSPLSWLRRHGLDP
jgi:murein DD-endopeptidase MepM/ murein hydrolase activator NlpD